MIDHDDHLNHIDQKKVGGNLVKCTRIAASISLNWQSWITEPVRPYVGIELLGQRKSQLTNSCLIDIVSISLWIQLICLLSQDGLVQYVILGFALDNLKRITFWHKLKSGPELDGNQAISTCYCLFVFVFWCDNCGAGEVNLNVEERTCLNILLILAT